MVVLSSMPLSSLPFSLNVGWIERSCYIQIALEILLSKFEKKSGGKTEHPVFIWKNKNRQVMLLQM